MDPELPWAQYWDTGPGAGTAVHVTRVVPAPRDEVFRCWTEPELLPRWFRPPGVTSVSAELDVRPGGSYRIAMQRPPEAAETYYQVGSYLEVAPPERLVFTFGWDDLPPLEALNEAHELDSQVTVQFRDLGDTTEVSVTHERLETENMRAFHRWGWESTLDQLRGTLGARG
jgi:uncharacterized protein YndB with AHSA1/START domain